MKFATVLAFILALSASSLAAEKAYKSVEKESTSDAFRGSPPHQKFDAFLGAGAKFFDSFGLSGKVATRIMDQGFIPDLNNSLFIEAGVGTTFYGKPKDRANNVTGFDFGVAARWDLILDKQWTFLGTIGFGYNATAGGSTKDVDGGGPFPIVGMGAVYSFNSEWAVRADAGYHFFGVGAVRRF